MMKEFEKARETYEQMEIPPELEARVQAGIRQGRARRSARRAWYRGITAAAACFVLTVGVLNVSPTVAAAAADVPVLGGLFQVLTVRDFTDSDGDRTVEVEQPSVTGSDFADRITQEIDAIVEEKVAEGEQIVQDYKEAFLATGGTLEQWEEKDNTVSVTYDIKSQTDTTVSFVVESYVSIASAYQETAYYNLDLAAGREITLEDVLGADWVALCNESIQAQIQASADKDLFFSAEEGGFTTVDQDTDFYLNEAGNPVVVFPRYAIAAGAAGSVEFEITV